MDRHAPAARTAKRAVPLDPPRLAEQFAVRVAVARAHDLRAYNSMSVVARDRPFLYAAFLVRLADALRRLRSRLRACQP